MLGSTTALFVIERLSGRVSRVTQLQKTDLKLPEGFIGDAINMYATKYSLTILDTLYFDYERNGGVIDFEMRNAFIANMPSVPVISKDYTYLVDECKELATEYDDPNGLPEIKLKSPSYTGSMSKKSRETRGWCARSISTGRFIDVVDAPPKIVTGWLWDFGSRDRQRIDKEAGHIARLSLANDGRQQ